MARAQISFDDLGVDVGEIVDAMKQAAHVESDADLADLMRQFALDHGLGKKYRPTAVGGWRLRRSIPLVDLWLFSRGLASRGLSVSLDELMRRASKLMTEEEEGKG
jgi:hypothetical protein